MPGSLVADAARAGRDRVDSGELHPPRLLVQPRDGLARLLRARDLAGDAVEAAVADRGAGRDLCGRSAGSAPRHPAQKLSAATRPRSTAVWWCCGGLPGADSFGCDVERTHWEVDRDGVAGHVPEVEPACRVIQVVAGVAVQSLRGTAVSAVAPAAAGRERSAMGGATSGQRLS